ncbi:hypothetical protein ACUNWD_01000 [Sunxiuqinia sp. A32]|uniref:hypothetical protein n=1 Tax=Sunxiuqinia sp. A32 TaxID=3461496 RepID=UPI00404650C1
MNWTDEFDGAVTICNRNGIIVYMNAGSKKQFAKYGGEALIGTNLMDCHSEKSKEMLAKMLESPCRNAYTIEKKGVVRQILQTPWMENGDFKGVVEISFEVPSKMQHQKRD